MQPKPIDSRRLLDVDAQKRTVEMAGFAERLRALRDHKEDPAETDYDVTHDEQGRRDSEETSRESAEKLKGTPVEDKREKADSPGKDAKKAPKSVPNGQKGSHLDFEA